MITKLPTIYIGYDPKENTYVDVLKKSIEVNTKDTYNIVPLVQPSLRKAGLFWRGSEHNNQGVEVDMFDGKPYSTQFSFTRFLVPFLNQQSGLALFIDSDMFVRSDITELFDTFNTKYALGCVKHDYWPTETTKMDNKMQTVYTKKNWSSVLMWNCDHPSNKDLTIADVNVKSGNWLHNFKWLESDSEIQEFHQEWNWLDGHSSEKIIPKNVHFTTGGPLFPNWQPKRDIDVVYAEEWKEFMNKHFVAFYE